MESNNPKTQDEHIKSEARKAMELSHLIKKAMKEARYDEAIEMIKSVLSNKDVPNGTKYGVILQKEKLERTLGTVIEIDADLDIEVSDAAQAVNKAHLIKEAMVQGRYDEAREMINSVLNDNTVSEGRKIMIRQQLQKLEKHLEEKSQMEKSFDSPIGDDKYYEMFNKYGISFTTQDLRDLEESPIVKEYYINKTPRFTRSKLYEGSIGFEDLEEIAEENRTTLSGCVFIAEACKYFCLEDLGMQALKGYRKANPNMTVDEQKAIAEAINLLKVKERHHGIGEKWNRIYERLDRVRKLQELDEDEKE